MLVLGLCPAVALAGEVEVEPEGTVEPVAVVQGEELAVQVDGVPYIDADGTTKTADGVQPLQSMTEPFTWGGEGTGQYWYVAGDGTSTTEVKFTGRVTVRGDVRLILADNATLTASKGITVTGDGNSLTIYAQSKEGDGVGKLEATGNWDAGIGSGDGGAGGTVTATGGSDAAGIGVGRGGFGGTVEIGVGLSVEAGASAETLDPSVTVASYCASDGNNHNGYAYARIYPATYTVTVADGIQNGTVSVDKETAAEGATVTVTATPADGYELEAVTVKDADGNQIEIRDGSFTMPAGNVTVSATFTKKASPWPSPTPPSPPTSSASAGWTP